MKCDYLIIGSGIAGLSYALRVAEHGQVVIVTKKTKSDTATNLAQGGIAAVMDSDDSWESHIADTLRSGDGLCDVAVVREVVKAGHDRVLDLINYGVDFVRENDSNRLSLGREGGHSHRRIAHAYDLTGKEIERALLERVNNHNNIILLENYVVLDLLVEKGRSGTEAVCRGAYVLSEDQQVIVFESCFTVLCTGGSGKVYLYTSNPDIATGDGVAIAFRAGAKIANMEFVQFHPTCLYHPQAKNFLISEAVRGEGARLVNGKGISFMEKYDSRGELATRDIVARSIDQELKESGDDCVFLDLRELGVDFIKRRFPTIYARCLSYGIDISKDLLPVVPAAHYQCGGVLVDTWARTSLANLLAIGEVACTGLHGANRLASNSLLEAVVYAERAAQYCLENLYKIRGKTVEAEFHSYDSLPHKVMGEEILISHNWDIIRRIMWNYVGIVRSEKRLSLAKKRLTEILSEIEDHYVTHRVSKNMVELRNIGHVAHLIVESARLRKESRGLHFCVDFPEKKETYRHWTVLTRKDKGKPWDMISTQTRFSTE
ncbi:L-aspartate oxidase [Desulfofustis limnaeus]|uniref:L-aspartate oxidase n=1 Tax=Desulfofustis limnaeus TaxID=2740163 RepID=UPI0024E02C05|nr:L-aspartate oxidase [Desulfofustis limnaeus]